MEDIELLPADARRARKPSARWATTRAGLSRATSRSRVNSGRISAGSQSATIRCARAVMSLATRFRNFGNITPRTGAVARRRFATTGMRGPLARRRQGIDSPLILPASGGSQASGRVVGDVPSVSRSALTAPSGGAHDVGAALRQTIARIAPRRNRRSPATTGIVLDGPGTGPSPVR